MKKSLKYLSIVICLLIIASCKENSTSPNLESDPDDSQPPIEANYETLDITITLPEGSDVNLAQTTVMSLSVESEVTATGQAAMAFNEGTTQMAYLLDAQDNLLMAGFVSEDQPEINIETTTEVFFYIGFGTITQPSAIKEKFVSEVQTIPGFEEFSLEMEQLFLTNPRMFQDGDYVRPLKEKVNELQQSESIDLPFNSLEVNGADIRSGLQLADVDFEHFTITNNYRRRAHTYIYKTAFKDENGKETVLLSEIESGTTADKDTEISPTGAIREFLGVFGDWASGKAADFAATTTDPIQLPLAESESEATYKVRVVGPGVAGINRDFDSMSSAEEEKFIDLHIETFLIDFFLPLFLDLKGHEGLLKKANLSEQAVKDLKKIVEPALASTPAAYNKLKEGKFTEAMSDYINAFRVNAAGSGMEDMLVNVFEFFGKKVSPGKYVQNQKIINNTIGKFTKIVGAIDIGLKTIDYGRLMHHIDSSYPLEEWTVKARRGDVKLTPKEQVAIPFARKELQVTTKEQLSDGAAFQYEWSTSGKYGVIYPPDGQKSGTSFTSSSNKIIYQGTSSSNKLDEGQNIEEIYVTVSIKMGNEIKKVNSDTAYIDVQPFRYEIRPDGMTMEGGQSVELNLERVDGFNPFEDTSVYDHKVVWSTSGAYGRFSGGLTTVTTYNSDSITYEALDEEVEDATETLTARIYFKLKDDSDYQLLDEAEGSITIDNDENTIILREPIRIETGRIDNGRCPDGGRAKFAKAIIPFKAPQPEEVDNYKAKVFVKGGRDVILRTWKHGGDIPQRHNMSAYNGVWGMTPGEGYEILIRFAITCSQKTINRALADFNQINAYGEITVTLKDQ